VFAFIDEAGDSGMKLDSGSSSHFCMVAAIFSDEFNADACDRAIAGLRRKLNKPSSYEFHFSHCSHSVKTEFLRCVAVEQFSYHAFIVDKRKLYSPRFNNSKHFYEFAVKILCDNAGDLMDNGKVVIDKNGDREFLRRLQASLRKLSNPQGIQIVRKVVMQDSRSNNLVQLADMTCGAVARSIISEDHDYRSILRKNGREKRVQCWPS
jgi:hypothetical protein